MNTDTAVIVARKFDRLALYSRKLHVNSRVSPNSILIRVYPCVSVVRILSDN